MKRTITYRARSRVLEVATTGGVTTIFARDLNAQDVDALTAFALACMRPRRRRENGM